MAEVISEERIVEEVRVEDAPSMTVLERLARLEKIAEHHGHKLEKHGEKIEELDEVVGI